MKAWIASVGMTVAVSSYGIEKTAVLPKGVRSVALKNVSTEIHKKYDNSSELQALADPLRQDYTFRKVVKGEEKMKGLMLEGFIDGMFNLDDSLGTFTADMRGRVNVTAPIISYGLTEKLTLAVAIPYYRAKMSIAMGFKENTALTDKFIAELDKEGVNLTSQAREVSGKLNNAVGELNKKLAKNDVAELRDWNQAGIGDITLAAKYRFLEKDVLRMASTSGVVAPTGRLNNERNMIAVPFGAGTWGVFTSLIVDQPITPEFFFNHSAKYTVRTPNQRNVRMVTADEKIEVGTERVRYKIGDMYEFDHSIQYDASYGLTTAVGFLHSHKFGDKYNTNNTVSKQELEKGKEEISDSAVYSLGYSTLPAFKRKEFPAPLTVALGYQKQMWGKNAPLKDLFMVDVAMFF